ncbi:MAG: RNA-binding cell elongation regulator Jag/EloR [Clostridia bacterium]|jgi:spoIIIJ-associated protein|nr:RNA-binding cell elongation regulator Jag/EloR [Clostridia bacterium]
MKSIEITARSVEEAIKQAAGELGVPGEEIDVEILEESSKGFLGFGGKMARIRASVKDDCANRAKGYLENVTAKMGIQASIAAEENSEYIKLRIEGDSMGVIIGRRGETLDALQYLTNLVANRRGQERRRIILDTEGYR